MPDVEDVADALLIIIEEGVLIAVSAKPRHGENTDG